MYLKEVLSASGWLANQILNAALTARVEIYKIVNSPSNTGMTASLALAVALREEQRFGDLDPDTTSYPFLALSRRLYLDYGTVLVAADVMSGRGPPLSSVQDHVKEALALLDPSAYAQIERCVTRERLRQEEVARG